jgi:hypothetical protein
MLICMRTTLVLDDQLLRQAKRQAAERNTTLSAVVNDALREALRPRAEKPRPFTLVTYRGKGPTFHLTPEDIKRLELEDDLERLR